MLVGIDISNHQGENGIVLSKVLANVDFCIVKATEGLTFTDKYCDGFVQKIKRAGKLWGFYHFARNNDPIRECDFFISQTKGYQNYGIPILDWEAGQSVAWVNKFVRRYYERTGVWPWIYANPWRFNQGGVESNCARWIASYPKVTHPSLYYDPGKLPKTLGNVVCWQYASDGRVDGYSGNLDVNHYYGDRESWLKYVVGAKVGTKTVKLEGSGLKVSVTMPAAGTKGKQTLKNSTYNVVIERS